jgi:predicted amidophosphoribosyltransferase
VISLPQSSRYQLTWSRFEQKPNGDWLLVLQPYYATLFSAEHNTIVKKSNTGWHESKSGKTRLLFFTDLTPDDIESINAFIGDYSQFILVGRSDNVAWYFSSELDFCMAIDYTFKSGERETRTDIGELKHQAKYCQKLQLTPQIVILMLPAFQRLMNLIGEPVSVTYLPPVRGSDYCLPELLAKGLYNLYSVSHQDSDVDILNARLKSRKPSFKNMSFKSKVRKCRKVYSESNVQFDGNVTGRNVLIIDDLYQSGASMWSFAGCLKSLGAAHVAGLVCVKTWGDRDNL